MQLLHFSTHGSRASAQGLWALGPPVIGDELLLGLVVAMVERGDVSSSLLVWHIFNKNNAAIAAVSFGVTTGARVI